MPAMKANYNRFLKLTYSEKKCNKYNKDRPDALLVSGQTSEQFVVYCMELDIVADLHSRLQETLA